MSGKSVGRLVEMYAKELHAYFHSPATESTPHGCEEYLRARLAALILASREPSK
jgi:hypothetical protein